MQLGIGAMINLDGTPPVTSLTAAALNLFLPVLVDFLVQNKPVPPVPDDIKSYLGKYGVKGNVLVTLDLDQNGQLSGSIAGLGSGLVFEWDPTQDVPSKQTRGTKTKAESDDDNTADILRWN